MRKRTEQLAAWETKARNAKMLEELRTKDPKEERAKDPEEETKKDSKDHIPKEKEEQIPPPYQDPEGKQKFEGEMR